MSGTYSEGTINVTNGSATVTGTGTFWVGTVRAGWMIKLPNGETTWVGNVVSDTELTLQENYTGTTQTSQNYITGPTGAMARDLGTKIQTLINDTQDVIDNAGTGQFAPGTLAEPGVRFINDPDTGIRRNAENSIQLVAGGSAQITSSGGVVTGNAVVDSDEDEIAGKLLRNDRAFGLGVDTPPAKTNIENVQISRFFGGNADNDANHPPNAVFQYMGISCAANSQNNMLFAYFRGENDFMGRARTNDTWDTNWHRFYTSENLIKTVSQDSGRPTGGVIERGSNANGSYVRFADGTQICAITGVTCAFVAANRIAYAWTFPAAFEAGGLVAYAGSATAAGGDFTDVDETDLGAMFFGSSTVTSANVGFRGAGKSPFIATSEVANCRFMATGRWF